MTGKTREENEMDKDRMSIVDVVGEVEYEYGLTTGIPEVDEAETCERYY